jgi:hypothetical protein
MKRKYWPVWAGMPKLAPYALVSSIKYILYYRNVGKSLPASYDKHFIYFNKIEHPLTLTAILKPS